MKSILLEILLLLKTGRVIYVKLSFWESLRKTLIIFLLSFIFSLLSSIIKIFGLELLSISINEKQSLTDFFYINGVWYGIIFTSVLVPVFEEIIFRLPLKYSVFNLAFAFFLFTYLLLSNALNIKIYNVTIYFSIRIFISLLLALCIYSTLSYSKRINNWLSNFWLCHSREIFWLSVILFGFGHIFKFEINPKILLILPIVTLPQLVYGTTLGYTRLKYGFIYSILVHIIINTIGSILVL